MSDGYSIQKALRALNSHQWFVKMYSVICAQNQLSKAHIMFSKYRLISLSVKSQISVRESTICFQNTVQLSLIQFDQPGLKQSALCGSLMQCFICYSTADWSLHFGICLLLSLHILTQGTFHVSMTLVQITLRLIKFYLIILTQDSFIQKIAFSLSSPLPSPLMLPNAP